MQRAFELSELLGARTVVVMALLATTSCIDTDLDAWTQADAKVSACFTEMDRDQLLAVVNAKFARRDPSEEQLVDQSVASESEADQLRLRIKKTRPCREMRLAAVRAHYPIFEPAYATLYYQSDQLFEYLIQGWITYGAANNLAKNALKAFREREAAFVSANERERAILSTSWTEALQRAHSNPPPDTVTRRCTWKELNIECE